MMTAVSTNEENRPIVLITGASSGLGLAIGKRLIRSDKYRVVLTARKTSLHRLFRLGLAEGNALSILPLDVTSGLERESVIREIEARHGSIDVLVNNAGVAYRSVVEEATEEERKRQMEVNYRAPMELTRLVLPEMRRKRNGQIINLSSVSGMMAMPTMSLYSASKFALEGATEALFYEVKPWKIRVSIVQAGFVNSSSFKNTRLTKASSLSLKSTTNAYYEHYANMRRLIRYCMNHSVSSPEDIARKVERIIENKNPPLRVPVTPDAVLFEIFRRYLPRWFYHKFLYSTLPNIESWGC